MPPIRFAAMINVSRQISRLSIALLSCTIFFSYNSAAQDSGSKRTSRLAPSLTITCNRNHLTSWTGEVTLYRRESNFTLLEISTDENTVERITLGHEGKADASSHYLLSGEKFMPKDWAAIEYSPGVLNNGMRVTVWICEDGKTSPVVDWKPPRD